MPDLKVSPHVERYRERTGPLLAACSSAGMPSGSQETPGNV
jgi:hypothetical protein